MVKVMVQKGICDHCGKYREVLVTFDEVGWPLEVACKVCRVEAEEMLRTLKEVEKDWRKDS